MKKITPTAPNFSPFVGGFEVTKIVREHIGLTRAESEGMTFGQRLDAMMEEAAMNGQELQSLKLEIDEAFWREYAEGVQRSQYPADYAREA